jgi:hypothetical protein
MAAARQIFPEPSRARSSPLPELLRRLLFWQMSKAGSILGASRSEQSITYRNGWTTSIPVIKFQWFSISSALGKYSTRFNLLYHKCLFLM